MAARPRPASLCPEALRQTFAHKPDKVFAHKAQEGDRAKRAQATRIAGTSRSANTSTNINNIIWGHMAVMLFSRSAGEPYETPMVLPYETPMKPL